MITAEYIWLDGTLPVSQLRSKTKIIGEVSIPIYDKSDDTILLYEKSELPTEIDHLPKWGFDGSSTNQAKGNDSDVVLNPVKVVPDPLRKKGDLLVLCDVLDKDDQPLPSSNRTKIKALEDKYKNKRPLFGIEQEYVFMDNEHILGWKDAYPYSKQGPYYCGIGNCRISGRQIAEEHMDACIEAGLKISGINAEVMLGQWEFQIGPASPTEVGDDLLLARYLLYRIAEKYKVDINLDPKVIKGDWNGSGCHTNFSTKEMRDPNGLEEIFVACKKLGKRFEKEGFPKEYGHDYEDRLTGQHETCSHKEFKFGIADRTASIRIPLHVAKDGKGYLEDRRPCSNIDPYLVAVYLLETTCS